MQLKTYLFILFSTTLLALGVWLLILFNFDPEEADFLTQSAYFASLFLWLGGLLTFLIFYLRIWFSNKEVIYTHLPVSLRQAILISLIIVGLLAFRALKVMTWWDTAMFVIVILLIEMFFRTRLVR